jgi:hypothetical protein
MELGGSLPHSQESTTCPYRSQISPFLCPSHFWLAQLVSFLVGLRSYEYAGSSMERVLPQKLTGLQLVKNQSIPLPITIWQAQLGSFLFGLRTHQHPGWKRISWRVFVGAPSAGKAIQPSFPPFNCTDFMKCVFRDLRIILYLYDV